MKRSVISRYEFLLARITALLAPGLLLTALLAPACTTDPPLDADTRQQIDSISFARIRDLRREMDSLCKEERSVRLPQLIDSIRQQRVREIQEQLKTVPK
jgi:hypothetical protein